MRLKKYINEAMQYVGIKDLPDWVKKILKEKKIGKEVKVEITKKVNIGSNWHDANVRYIYAYRKGEVKGIGTAGGIKPWNNKEQNAAGGGFKTDIGIEDMILVTNSKPKMAELYVHPDAMVKALDQGNDGKDLSKNEILALAIIKSLKAFARREEATRWGIEFDSMVSSLKDKKYIMKNGAINKKGKNFLLSYYNGQIHEVAKKLGIKEKKWDEY